MMKASKAQLHIRPAKRKEAKVVSSILYEAFIDFKPLYTPVITPAQFLIFFLRRFIVSCAGNIPHYFTAAFPC